MYNGRLHRHPYTGAKIMTIELVKQEVLDWHQFLHQFFRAEIPAEAFSRMAPVLTEEFQSAQPIFDLAQNQIQ